MLKQSPVITTKIVTGLRTDMLDSSKYWRLARRHGVVALCLSCTPGLAGHPLSFALVPTDRAPIEFPNFELYSIRRESSRIEPRNYKFDSMRIEFSFSLFDSIRFDKIRLYIEIRSRKIEATYKRTTLRNIHVTPSLLSLPSLHH